MQDLRLHFAAVHRGVFAVQAAVLATAERQQVAQVLATTATKVVHGIIIAVSVFVFSSVMAVQVFMIGVQTILAQHKAAAAPIHRKHNAAVGQANAVPGVCGRAATAVQAAEINKNHKHGHLNGVIIRCVAIRSVQYGVKQLVPNPVHQLVQLDTIGGI